GAARVGEVWRGKFETGKLFAVILVLAGIGVIGWVVGFEVRLRGTHLPSSRRAASDTGPQLAGMEYAAAAAGEMKVMPRLIGSPRQISLKLKASEPLRRRAVVPLSKPSRVFGGGMVAEPAAGDGKGGHQLELEPVAETFESVEPVVEQAAGPEPELSAVETPEPVFTEPEEIHMPEIQSVVAEPEEIHVSEIEPVFAKAPEAVFEAEMEPVGQGQPIPQLTPVEEPSIVEVTEPEPARFAALRELSEPLIAPEPIFEPPIYEPTTPVNMPESIQIPTAPSAPSMREGAPQAGAVQKTGVQVMFSFEIASMQLTPTF